eukprot:TRINITY_DN7903_c0_g1_i1.p1 TRINITY_DN7903_c0_g1~~TRINITY_DN7903_c0_g1_i1.p1  ORF type:complete len:332 (-),score=26.60 TRINITY_DN7903_c0_g1_i1:155-1150(-)
MLDCSSSYIQISILKEYLDAMLFNKLNTLVMNVAGIGPIRVDINRTVQQQFEVYSDGELLDLNVYAQTRGISLILGIESQTGYQLEAELFNAKLVCQTTSMPLRGELDFHSEQTKDFLKSLIKKIGALSSEEMVYIGGRELNTSQHQCDQNSRIGRKEACEYLKQFYPEKKCLVFVEGSSENQTLVGNSLPEGSVQIFAVQSSASFTLDYPSIIIDYSLNLHEGVGPQFTTTKTTLTNWPTYQNKGPNCGDSDVCLGGLLLLEYQAGQSIAVRTWIRATIWSEGLWNKKISQNRSVKLRRLARMERRLTQWGVRNAPFTCEYCTLNMWDCF